MNKEKTVANGTITGLRVKLLSENKNVFVIMAKVKNEMERCGIEKVIINNYLEDATSEDYDNLLRVTSKYVEIY